MILKKDKERIIRLWDKKREGMTKTRRRRRERGKKKGNNKERDRDNVKENVRDKSSDEPRNNWQRARNSGPVQPRQSYQTHSPGSLIQTHAKSSNQYQSKTTTTTVRLSTTLPATVRARARRKAHGWETRRGEVFMGRSTVGPKRINTWTGHTRRSARMQGGSEVFFNIDLKANNKK